MTPGPGAVPALPVAEHPRPGAEPALPALLGAGPAQPGAETALPALSGAVPALAPQPVRVTSQWLRLREPADAAARASDLVDLVRAHLPAAARIVVHDLGCGTGSMARWLAPRLGGEQHWVMYDRDADLLTHAVADLPRVAGGAAVTAESRQRDITRLELSELADASLVTASALLDMFTVEELDRFVSSCVAANCPVLVTISVIGRVELNPADPLDDTIADAFNAHQRRVTDGRRLLGPDAVGAAVDAFTRHGAEVFVRPSPWLLGENESALAVEWLRGWLGAACQQRPELTEAIADNARRRLALAVTGRLGVTVHHHDLLALPR